MAILSAHEDDSAHLEGERRKAHLRHQFHPDLTQKANQSEYVGLGV